MNYYISDLHLFHEASIRFDNRPFASLEEMHEAVVRRWNNKVNNKYLTTIIIYITAYDKAMLEMMQKANIHNISIDNIKTLSKGDIFMYEVDLWVKSIEHLNNFIRDITSFKYVEDVVRVMK